MIGKPPEQNQSNLFGDLKTICNPSEPLIQLSEKIPWKELEDYLSPYYSKKGRPAMPIRLMTSLLILKQLYNKGDETVIESWIQNPYWQYFSGEQYFQWRQPLDPSDLVHFRKRIGEAGVQKILEISVNLFPREKKEKEILIDTTVHEKNITYPTDVKLTKKIIEHCNKIARKEGISQRQSYRRELKRLMLAQRFKKHPKKIKKARAAEKRMKTIAGRLIRELERKLSTEAQSIYREAIETYKKVLAQKRDSKNKIYSLHEPEVACIAKGKAHKKYEFGSKAAIALTKKSGIILGVASFAKNIYDGNTLDGVLSQVNSTVGKLPKFAIVDRGFRGRKQVRGVEILPPKPPGKRTSQYEKRKARLRFRRRASIEPIIGHLKSDHRMARNYLKGSVGDSINLTMAAAAFNFKKYMNRVKNIFEFILRTIWSGVAYHSPAY